MRPHPQRDAVTEFVWSHVPATVADIVQAMLLEEGMSEQQTLEAIEMAHDESQIMPDGKGNYIKGLQWCW